MNTQANANLGAVQIYEDKSIFAAPLMSDDEWNAMSEEHQASQLAVESKLLAMANDIAKDIPYLSAEELMTFATSITTLKTVLSTKEGRKAAAEAMRGDK